MQGDAGSIPGSGRAPRGGNGNPLQYSCLKNPMVRGAWQATVQRVAKNQTLLRTHTHKHTHADKDPAHHPKMLALIRMGEGCYLHFHGRLDTALIP